MPTKTTKLGVPAGKRQPGRRNITKAGQERVRRAARALYATHGSDGAVVVACAAAGHTISAPTICRVRADIPAGRKVAEAIAAAMGVPVADLLAGKAVGS